jgi:protein-disulfide isomerase
MRWLVPLAVVLALPAGFAGAALWDLTGLGNRTTRDYLLANPEVLPEAMNVLQKREESKRIEPMRAELERPFPGAVLGNPNGKVTLVEFSDYACSYCRASVEDVQALVAAAREAGVDLDRAHAAIAGGAFDAQLRANVAMAQVLGIDGTPGWVAGDRILQGALGRQAIGKAISEVRAS